MSGGPTRQDTHRITVRIFDQKTKKYRGLGVWDKFTGGDVDSTDTTYRPGSMGDPVSLGGVRTTNNITVSRLYRLERDHDHLQFLIDSAGVSDAIVSRRPMTIEGEVYGQPTVYHCKFKHVTPPDLDSEQAGAALIALEFSVHGFPTT